MPDPVIVRDSTRTQPVTQASTGAVTVLGLVQRLVATFVLGLAVMGCSGGDGTFVDGEWTISFQEDCLEPSTISYTFTLESEVIDIGEGRLQIIHHVDGLGPCGGNGVEDTETSVEKRCEPSETVSIHLVLTDDGTTAAAHIVRWEDTAEICVVTDIEATVEGR